MIPGLDSAQPPTADQVAAARAAGVRIWNGYIATRPQVGLLNVWSQADFEVARGCGSTPIAFCSGWDDPVILGQLARAWNVRLCLDDEEAIRPDGPWVQPFLDASGAGLYGNWWLHTGRRAAFHILSAYPTGGDPAGTSWWTQTARPAGPCGWQWAGSHIEFGLDVDSEWLDDWFGGDPEVPNAILITGDQSQQDPHGQGAVYLVANWPYGPKRYIPDPAETPAYVAEAGAVVTKPQALLDRCYEEDPIVSGSYVVVDAVAARAELDAAKAELDKLQAGGVLVDLSSVNTRLDKLAAHLGQGQP